MLPTWTLTRFPSSGWFFAKSISGTRSALRNVSLNVEERRAFVLDLFLFLLREGMKLLR